MSFHHLVLKKPEKDSLVLLDKAKELIQEARTIDEARDLKEQMTLTAFMASEHGLENVEQKAHENVLWAKRRIGELLIKGKETGEVAKVGRPENNSRPSPTIISSTNAEVIAPEKPKPKTIQEHGLSRDQAATYQKLAKIPKKEFEERLKSKDVTPKRPATKFQAPSKIAVDEDHMHEFNWCWCGQKLTFQHATEAAKQ